MNRISSSSPLLKTAFTAFCLLSLTCAVFAEPNFSAAQAAQHIGETASVTDKVEGVHESGKGNMFLNMGGRYPNQAFTAYVPASAASEFPNLKAYEGKTVTVSGKIELYKGKPEIVVKSKAQIQEK